MKLHTLGCWGGYPYQGAGTTSFLLTSQDGFNLLIDVGSRAVTELEKVLSPLDLDAVIISHYHPDHIADLGVLGHYRLLHPQQSPILPVYGHAEDQGEFAKLTMANALEGRAYQTEQVNQLGPFEISFIKTVHPVVCYAMRIVEVATEQVLVFTGDTGYFEGLADFATGADLFLADVYFFEGQENHPAHLTSKEAGQIARQAGVNRLVLTHLPQFAPRGMTGDHLEILRQQAQVYAGEHLVVDLAAPHQSWDLGDLS
ncbi:MBL fold metallo-hydrolase [Streptococcus cuniculipharyngis]|uniref:MBL fold metallo-hydrolase n=1 Tax=Streptococcus cuniculipharyngis TaxID=1562651 RepID=A0A5C5SBV5_9STRE|nr:MBL fold metallo-hydrolase [Streptococcus cuniculipharyngis]TWS97402.1 MBL fold metallo-hydrolase [Streptococcus cuniculipharyngis]